MNKYSREFFYLLDTKAKKTIPLLVLVFVFSSLLDVVGIGLVGVFLGLLTNPHFFLQKYPSIDLFLQGLGEEKRIIIFGLLIISAFAIKAIVTLAIQNKIVYFCLSLSVRLKIRMMTAY